MKPFVLSLATWFIFCCAAQSAVALMSAPVFFSATWSSFTTEGMFTHSPMSTASPDVQGGEVLQEVLAYRLARLRDVSLVLRVRELHDSE